MEQVCVTLSECAAPICVAIPEAMFVDARPSQRFTDEPGTITPLHPIEAVLEQPRELAPANAPPTPDQLFEALLSEFLQKHRSQNASQKKPNQGKKPDSEPVVDVTPITDAPRRPYTGRLERAFQQYLLNFQAPTADYDKLFSYLGKLQTAQEMYRDHYSDSSRPQQRLDNDAEALSERIVDREILRDRKNVWGAGLIEYTDPFERERYTLYKQLMSETMKMVRQMFVAM